MERFKCRSTLTGGNPASTLISLGAKCVYLLGAIGPISTHPNEALLARLFVHGGLLPFWGSATQPLEGDSWGGIKASDPATGEEVWSLRTEHPIVASTLATTGGLVFTGTPTGEFLALDARTGEQLWSFRTGNGIHSNPVTYSVDGKPVSPSFNWRAQ